MDQEPDPNSYTTLTGNIDQTVLTYDPILMGSVQPVPPPPAIKPLPPCAPPPANATIYNPIKDVNKFTDDFYPVHNACINGNADSDMDNEINFYNESIWDENGKYKLYKYNKLNGFTGQYEISEEPPNKKRKLMENDYRFESDHDESAKDKNRYSLTSLGFQPLAAAAIIEQLDNKPKLRYCEEFHRDINRFMELETHSIINKTNDRNNSVQSIFPTSNGISKKYLYTECGINPNDSNSVNKLRAHLLSKSISTMIHSKQKQNLDCGDISQYEMYKKETEKHKKNEIINKAQQKSFEIAKKLGFIPQYLKNTSSDNEIRETDPTSKKLKLLIAKQKAKLQQGEEDEMCESQIAKANQLLADAGLAPPPALQKQSAFTQFECKSVLKCDGSEYDKYNSNIKLDISIKKYDSQFRPMFPITNAEYKFKIVSQYGYKLLNKYGYKKGDGLGKNKQGVTTFPRLTSQGQNSFKGINYNGRNRKNLSMGFIHCIACDKAFCGYQNLSTHILCKKHLKNLLIKPNNLVLLCVQCQIQFPTLQKIKEHYMLVQHDEQIPGILAFQKQLKHELLKNQLKYIQSMKTTPNPFNMNVDDDVEEMEIKQVNEKEEEEEIKQVPNISLPLPHTQQKQPQPQKQPVMPAPTNAQTQAQIQAYNSQYYNQYYNQYYAQYYGRNGYNYAQYYNQQYYNQQYYNQQQQPIEIPINTQICNDIKHKIYTLGLKLPMAVPTVPWIYCPSCGSFYTTFIKFNNHYNTQRHINSMQPLNETDKAKMNELFVYITEKQQQYANQSY